MAFTVFYSWQSDRPNAINRNFIENALKKAIRSIGQDIEILKALRDQELSLDKDTQGIPGLPPIVDVIFEKISQCGVFVPDVTFIGHSDTDRTRMLPNPNVLIEYGWALRALSNKRIVAVMNATYGEPSWESLPFDIRHRRFPITYQLREDAGDDERTKAKQGLVNDLARAIRLIIKNGLIEKAKLPAVDQAHQEIKSTTDPSNFLKFAEPFAKHLHTVAGDKTVFIPTIQHVFLRIIPTKAVDEIKTGHEACDLAKAGGLAAMDDDAGGTYGRNKYGAFVCYYQDDNVLRMTQLFKNRELWGIDCDLLEKQGLMERAEVNHGIFPWVALERRFLQAMSNYLTFAQETLQLPLPLSFRAGVTNVEGYRMTAPPGLSFSGFEKFGGRVVEPHIVYDGKISTYNDNASTILHPFFDHVWAECGLTRPV